MQDGICFKRQGNVIYQTIDNETVIINLENGRYYSLNATASAVWEDLMQQYAIDAIGASFARRGMRTASEVAAALDAFVTELVEETLIETDGAGTVNTGTLQSKEMEFETPQLEKFTDMERLLPLDPIHQVGELGWPFAKESGK